MKPKNKVLILIIAILLITDVSVSLFFLLNKRHEKQSSVADREAYMAGFLKGSIGFDAQQLSQYDSLSKNYVEKVRMMIEDIKDDKEQLVKHVAGDSFSDSSINEVSDFLSEKQKAIDLQLFRHLKRIRSLCTPAQQPVFDSLIYKAINKKIGE